MTERKLKKVDTLFMSAGQATVTAPSKAKSRLDRVPHSLIDPHPKHHFKPYDPKKYPGLLASIRAMGVLQPVLMQAKPDGRYTMLAGYKRLCCNKLAGYDEILALIDDDLPETAAELIVTQTNTTQLGLGDLLPSELAYALKLELEAFTELRRQLRSRGEKSGEVQIGDKVYNFVHLEKSRDSLAQSYGMKGIDVQRFAQLTDLVPELLDLVDQKKLAISAAVPLSTLTERAQAEVLTYIGEGHTITTVGAQQLKQEAAASILDMETIKKILGEVSTPTKASKVSLRSSVVKRYFTRGESAKEIESTVAAALEFYFANRTKEETT